MTVAGHASSGTPLPQGRILAVLRAVHAWSEARQWRGHEKHDALNSPWLARAAGGSRVARLVAIQAVMRAPFDVRGLLRVEPSHNPKGLALFAQSCLDLAAVTREREWTDRAMRLGALLESTARPARSGARAWGYLYPWQDAGFFAPSGTPNAVVTCHVCEALLDVHEALGDRRCLELVDGALGFLLVDLRRLVDRPGELCLSYMPVDMQMRVMDVSILVGALLARWGRLTADSRHAETSARLVRYVVNRQTPEGAWFYTDPPGDSPIRHDNYHTGFILDALWRYVHATRDEGFRPAYDAGLSFYRLHLFEPDGAPRWMSDRRYPLDVHGAAQGILTFARHEREFPGFADRIASWAVDRLYHPDGRFLYQQGRFVTKRFTFMRWCNGWMARALAHLLRMRTT